MKFSWKLINIFVDITNKSNKEFKEQLVLSGIEVESIQNTNDTQDRIIDISLTTNRREIHSTINLAKEIAIINNNKLKVIAIGNFGRMNICDKEYVSINEISSIQHNDTPEWINQYLKVHEVKKLGIIYSIRKYIEIKWGYTFNVLRKSEVLQIFSSTDMNGTDKSKMVYTEIILKYDHNSQFLVFTHYKNKTNKTESRSSEYYFNGYIDTLKILSTFTKCRTGKSYCISTTTNRIKKAQKIEINQARIIQILGQLSRNYFKCISSITILSTLKQLYFMPEYDQLAKTFVVKIPTERKHDIHREIDVVEEIGRIKGFNNFESKLSRSDNKGRKYKSSIKIRKLRKILREFGFNEVINCSLVNNNVERNTIKIYNPLTKEQCELRNSILENLIRNYIYNIKQTSHEDRVEIFEIGKVFRHKAHYQHTERIHIGGLICNNTFTRTDWRRKANHSNFFHLKGIIEMLTEKLNSQVYFKKISDRQLKTENYTQLFHNVKNIGVYSKKNGELVGILGEINPSYIKGIKLEAKRVYMFEINIGKLIESISRNNHLEYSINDYSLYPCVTRDISIKTYKTISVESIQQTFRESGNHLLQSIDLFNEYLDKKSRMRSISLRITYRSKERTLSSSDINKIDQDIINILSKFKSKT